jgi:ABC-type lipoprotein release transport system permease subunit
MTGGAAGIGLVILVAGLFRDPIALVTGIQILLPSPLALVGLAGAGLGLALVSVTLAAWLPASRLSQQEPALAMRE